MKFTPEQIQTLADKYGVVFHLVADEDKECVLRKPTRQELGLAMAEGKKNPLKFNEVILNRTWIEGDADIQTNDDLFFSVSGQLDQLIETKQAEIKKYSSQSVK